MSSWISADEAAETYQLAVCPQASAADDLPLPGVSVDLDPGRGAWFYLGGLAFACAVSEGVLRGIRLRLDGLPYSNQTPPADKGVAVYFTHKKQAMCFACDRWDRVQDNIYAIAMTIQALRGIERWGSGSMVEQAFLSVSTLDLGATRV